MPISVNYCQNLWHTLALREIGSEMVTLLEDRISPEIFVRHYWSPNTKQEIERVRKAIDSLADQLYNILHFSPIKIVKRIDESTSRPLLPIILLALS
ncbi:MAG: hypothetical protein ACJ71D_01805 [Nitrososphaera sp.]